MVEMELRTGARLVEAIDAERRRVERDLHDGAQQRLVSLGLTLRSALAQAASRPDPALEACLTQALAELQAGLAELRELAQGIYPAILTQRGLAAAVTSLADRAPLVVEVAVEPGRHPVAIETTAYFVICEALTNAARHARASAAAVTVGLVPGRLVVEVADDGIGGADVARGTGLVGLADRVAALGGRLMVESPPGGGTRVRAELPYPGSRREP